jgi:hypothetical protein
MVCLFLYLLHQALDLRNFGGIGGDTVCAGAGGEVRQGIESCNGGRAGRSFAGRYEDFGAACLEKSGRAISYRGIGACVVWKGLGRGRKYPDAACKPSPREPPVTTATFPSSENMFLKS